MKKNKSLIILLLILTVGLVGLTIAYFTNSSTITNEFSTNPYGTTVTEEFVSPQNWLPGTSTDKSLTVTNSGQVDEAVRISYSETWTSRSAKNNDEEGDLPLTQNGNRAALIHFTNTDDWTKVGDYYYYNYKLAPNESTSELLDYVTFNPAITNSSNCVENITATGKTITCNSTGTGYDDATYKLVFNIETIQYDKYKTVWGTNVNIASMKPMNATQLALKSNPVSITNYTDGNVHEMYTFNHAATEQTPALTDYRYIGNDPYNYVYFNCDSLDNQNSETCEVWRIIGVFDVERPDPNDNTQTITERRMKLVSNSVVKSKMPWSLNNRTDWSTTNINIYLNGEYYNSINIISKSLIDNAIYYLGGIDRNSTIHYGTTEDIYLLERGNNLCSSCENDVSKLFWNGQLALMYPSDIYMTYSYNVDNDCFEDPYLCNSISEITSNPLNSWIYNGNWIWLLSHFPHSSSVYYTGGPLYSNDSVINLDVRPVLYLSSNVKITEGTGEQSNPYKLGL